MVNVNIRDDNNNINIIIKINYCKKCSKELPEGSTDNFCDFYCKQEFYAENAKELIACHREWMGID